jgi:hypothetical protein
LAGEEAIPVVIGDADPVAHRLLRLPVAVLSEAISSAFSIVF